MPDGEHLAHTVWTENLMQSSAYTYYKITEHDYNGNAKSARIEQVFTIRVH